MSGQQQYFNSPPSIPPLLFHHSSLTSPLGLTDEELQDTALTRTKRIEASMLAQLVEEAHDRGKASSADVQEAKRYECMMFIAEAMPSIQRVIKDQTIERLEAQVHALSLQVEANNLRLLNANAVHERDEIFALPVFPSAQHTPHTVVCPAPVDFPRTRGELIYMDEEQCDKWLRYYHLEIPADLDKKRAHLAKHLHVSYD